MITVVNSIQIEPFRERRLASRLVNWGLWLSHDSHIGPNHERCSSIEANYQEDALGEVMSDIPYTRQTPDVADAEKLQKLISQLPSIEQYALAMEYARAPGVMKWRRVSDHNMKKAAGNGFNNLQQMLKK